MILVFSITTQNATIVLWMFLLHASVAHPLCILHFPFLRLSFLLWPNASNRFRGGAWNNCEGSWSIYGDYYSPCCTFAFVPLYKVGLPFRIVTQPIREPARYLWKPVSSKPYWAWATTPQPLLSYIGVVSQNILIGCIRAVDDQPILCYLPNKLSQNSHNINVWTSIYVQLVL